MMLAIHIYAYMRYIYRLCIYAVYIPFMVFMHIYTYACGQCEHYVLNCSTYCAQVFARTLFTAHLAARWDIFRSRAGVKSMIFIKFARLYRPSHNMSETLAFSSVSVQTDKMNGKTGCFC